MTGTDTPAATGRSAIRSMTGFATVRRETEAGELSLSLRTVNHRGLDLHFHHAPEMAQFETAMRSLIKSGLARGHVEIRTSLTKNAAGEGTGFNREALLRYADAFRQAARELRMDVEPDLNVLIGLPGVLVKAEENRRLEAGFMAEIQPALTECIRELNAYREREGAELTAHIREELDGIEGKTNEIRAIRKQATTLFHQRLAERLRDLLQASGVSEGRMVEEAAMLADRSDVQEEVTRLAVHAKELRLMLAGGGEIGKRLDFLLQEMNREANTVLSKTSGVGDVGLTITSLALALKAHIDKIREQALNLE